MAFAFVRRLRDKWWKDCAPDRLFHAPVPIPIAMSNFAPDVGEDLIHALPERLSKYLFSKFGLKQAPDPYALANCLGRERKLILVFYDQPSPLVWQRLTDPKDSTENYRARIVALRSLASTALERTRRWQQQFVIAICSDFHHKAMWQEATSSS